MASPGRPPEFDRGQVLDQAMLLFWKQGYEATSMSDLTTALGIGRQSLYGAFGDKRRLFVECLERYMDQVLARSMFAILEGDGSPLQAIERVFDAWEGYANSNEFFGCLLGKSLAELGRRDSELDALMRRKLDRMQQSFEQAALRAKAAGELRADTDARALARSLTAFAQGAAVVCQVWRGPEAVHETLLGARGLLALYRA
jgi:AcrR family transcriptional regulator